MYLSYQHHALLDCVADSAILKQPNYIQFKQWKNIQQFENKIIPYYKTKEIHFTFKCERCHPICNVIVIKFEDLFSILVKKMEIQPSIGVILN